MIYIATIAVFASLLIFLYALIEASSRKDVVIDKLDAYDADKMLDNEFKLLSSAKAGPIQKIAKRIEKMSSNNTRKKKNAMLIKQADLPITYEELLVIKVMAAFSFGFLTAALTKNPIIVITVVIFIWILPIFIINSRKKKKIIAFDAQLNEGLIMISNALKAGYSFLQALAVAAEETQDPFSKEFKGLLKELSLGIPIEDGLTNLLERVPSEDLKLIMNAILIQKDVGGNLSEILENIAETIRERQRIKNEVKTLTAQGKMSATIILVMPFFIAAIIYLFDNEYILTLFTTLIGRFMLVFAMVGQVLGFVSIKKIIKIDY